MRYFKVLSIFMFVLAAGLILSCGDGEKSTETSGGAITE